MASSGIWPWNITLNLNPPGAVTEHLPWAGGTPDGAAPQATLVLDGMLASALWALISH